MQIRQPLVLFCDYNSNSPTKLPKKGIHKYITGERDQQRQQAQDKKEKPERSEAYFKQFDIYLAHDAAGLTY